MSQQKQLVNPKTQQEYTPGEFVEAYNELCEKMGYFITIEPGFKKRDDGTFSVVLIMEAKKLIKNPV